mgnify:CR=1 FL=1
MIPFVNLNNPLPTTPGTGLTAGQEAQLAAATRRQPVTTIAALKALTPSNGDAVQVLGFAAAGDGGAGVFRYDSASSGTAITGMVVAPDSGTGRWFRVYSGAVNVRWFGAKGDGVTDDTVAIQAALTAAPADGRVTLPPGVYRIGATLTVSKKLYIDGSGASLSETAILAPMLALDSSADGSTVRGLTFVGSETIGTFPGDTTALDRTAITVSSADDVLIDGIKVTGKSSGVKLYQSAGGTVQNSRFSGFIVAPTAGANNSSATNIEEGTGCRVLNTSVANMGSAALVRLEAQRAVIHGVRGENLYDNGVYISSGDAGSVTGCTFDNLLGDGSTGIKVRGSRHTVVGNTVSNATNGGAGIMATGNGETPDAQGRNGSGTVIAGNTITTTGHHGIYLGPQDGYFPRDFIVTGNCLSDTATDGGGFTAIYAQGDGHIVQGNNIDGFSGAFGIASEGSSGDHFERIKVGGNTITGNTVSTAEGIRFLYVDDSAVESNIVTLTGTGQGIRMRITDSVVVRNNIGGTVYWDTAGNSSTNGVCYGNSGGVAGNLASVLVLNNPGATNGVLLIGPTKHSGGTAAPTTGTWARGDVMWNTAPAAGGAPGWVCTAAGTPGTWKAMANLAA